MNPHCFNRGLNPREYFAQIDSFYLQHPSRYQWARRGGCKSNIPLRKHMIALWCILLGCSDFNFLPTSGFFIKPLKAKLLAGEQKATKCSLFSGYAGPL